MQRVHPAVVVAIALATGLGGWLVGREEGSAARSTGSTESGEPQQIARSTRPERPTRPSPLLEGARDPSPRAQPSAEPTTAPEGSPETPQPAASGAAPTPMPTPAPIDIGSLLGPRFLGGNGAPFEPVPPPEDLPAVAEASRLMGSSPEEARDRLARLLDSNVPEERAGAYRLLGQARHPSQRELVERAVKEGKPGDDVRGLIRALANYKDRPWSVKQLTGPPDTPMDGDLETAWASKTGDMGEVWIDLTYAEAVRPEGVRVHETYNPGAIARVLGQRDDGSWTLLWSGNDANRESPGWFEAAFDRAAFATRSIRLIVDTDRIQGWNELDAVELLGDGRRQWAVDALAGSSYSD